MTTLASIRTAEAKINARPVDASGFSNGATVVVSETDWHDIPAGGREAVKKAAGKACYAALAEAGYVRGDDGRYTRDGIQAIVVVNDHVQGRIHLSAIAGREAWHCGANGYLPSGSRPQV